MGEGGNGYTFNTNELVEIAYVYIHKEARGKKLGDGSSYFKAKNLSYRMYMYLLGSPAYSTDKMAIDLSKTIPKFQIQQTKELFQELNCYLDPNTSKEFIPAAENPNITIQGYYKDLNGDNGGAEFWNRVRWYVYYVYSGKIPKTNNLFVLLGTDAVHKNATFLVDEKELNKFVNENKNWIDKQQAPRYDQVKDKFNQN